MAALQAPASPASLGRSSLSTPAPVRRGLPTPATSRGTPSRAVEAQTPEHNAREIDTIVRRAIGEVLGDSPYRAELADAWCDQILDRSLRQIAGAGWPFKYVATCVVSKQTGAVLDTAATAFWDTQSDSLCCTRRGNGMVDVIVTVYAMQAMRAGSQASEPAIPEEGQGARLGLIHKA
eukprot:CAMPEP_0171107758 /NCGR_PEP_ID=MMETSP0766_2-20121228/67512_1 /TAXON_ID=439317 /ORGANISM="Gambierdiscus australes, Strain CAWD 149" /LENGTH=177 /DNA_ID=CAMNT_0011569147 /DNA_START=95 /DNA_END=627 /DNA_ORIENTATION=-